MQRLAWLVAATAACGSVNKAKLDAPPPPADASVDAPPDPLAGAKSGSRLKIEWAAYADGTKQFWSWHDAQLDADCYPQNFYGDPTTKLYCIPNTDSTYYSDAACTQRFTFEYNSCNTTHQKYASEYEYTSSNCMGGVAHLYSLGAMIATPASYYYKDYSTGMCNPQGATPTTNYVSYAVGAEVTPSSLVEVTASAPSAGAVGVINWTSADGMTIPAMLHDTANDADCSPNYVNQATTAQCYPNNTTYGGYYQDTACQTSMAYAQTACTAPKFASTYAKTQCATDQPSVVQLGTALTPQPTNQYYWNAQAQTCNNNGIYSGYTYYNLGAPVTLPSLGVTYDVISGRRLQSREYTTGSTRFRNFTGYDQVFDSTLGENCYAQQMFDGTYRCLPNLTYTQQFYSDSGCTNAVPLAQYYKGATASCASPPAPTFAYQQQMVGTCYTYDIYRIGAKYTGTVYTMSGTCVVYSQAAQYDFYQIGPQVPLVGLASATLQIDP